MIVHWNDNTSTKFEDRLSDCKKLGEVGFYNGLNGKLVLILWVNIKFIELT